MNRDNTIVLFDIDGTLTKPRNIISSEMKQILEKLMKTVSIGLVSGSNSLKIKEQMDEKNIETKYDFIFYENGLVSYGHGKFIESTKITDYVSEKRLKEFINFTFNQLSKIDVPVKRGNFVDFRTGMINISPCGRSVTQEERDQFYEYDMENNVRLLLVEKLKKEFPEFKYSVGGQISVDVFPHGWDKTFCLQYLKKYNNIFFFGDNTSEGKNDYEIYSDPRTIGYTVKSPEDTIKKIKEIFIKKI